MGPFGPSLDKHLYLGLVYVVPFTTLVLESSPVIITIEFIDGFEFIGPVHLKYKLLDA